MNAPVTRDSTDSGAMRRNAPPHNYEAEQALLGALLANNTVYDKVAGFLLPEHFADAMHARAYQAIGLLIGQGTIANAVTLRRHFDSDQGGDPFPGGTAQYMVDLSMSVVTVINADDYGKVIWDCWKRREVITMLDAARDDLQSDNLTAAVDQIEQLEGRLAAMEGSSLPAHRVLTMGEAAYAAVEQIDKARREGIAGMKTGSRSLDVRTGGLYRGDLIILAGRPAMGKTTLATNIGERAARLNNQDGRKEGAVFIVTQEMGAAQIAAKGLSARTNINLDRQRSGQVSDSELRDLIEAQADLAALPIFIDDAAGVTPGQVLARARRIQRKHGLALIIIDYLQLMKPDDVRRNDNKVSEITAISGALKGIAKTLYVPVIALSQLSRKVEEREEKRPILSDLRESGSIEQDADLVMFVYRDEYYLRNEEPRKRTNESDEKFDQRRRWWEDRMAAAHNISEIIIAKHRQGRTGTVKQVFDGDRQTFTDIYHGGPDGGPDGHGPGGGE